MITREFDPLDMAVQAFGNLHPDLHVRIAYVGGLSGRVKDTGGLCVQPADRETLEVDRSRPAEVFVDASASVLEATEILIHELAHVVSCSGCDGVHHDQAFYDAERVLTDEWNRLAEQFDPDSMTDLDGAAQHVGDPDEYEVDQGRLKTAIVDAAPHADPQQIIEAIHNAGFGIIALGDDAGAEHA